MFKSLFNIVIGVLLAGGMLFIIIGILNIIKPAVKGFMRAKGIKRRYKVMKSTIRKEVLLFPYEFLKWVMIDFIRGKDRFKLYGIWAFTGYYGSGKTIGAIKYAKELKKKYPDISIYANFKLTGQQGRVRGPEDILSLEFEPGRKIIILDEIQSTFASTKWAEFPIEVLWGLTQCRKAGMAIFCTTPVFTRMAVQLRESTDFVIECKNVLKLDRWFRYKFYRADQYEKMINSQGEKKVKPDKVRGFIMTDRDYKSYDTRGIVERWEIKKEDVKLKALREEIMKKTAIHAVK